MPFKGAAEWYIALSHQYQYSSLFLSPPPRGRLPPKRRLRPPPPYSLLVVDTRDREAAGGVGVEKHKCACCLHTVA